MTSAYEREIFDRMLERALERLPEEAKALLDEVTVLVEDEPSREVLADMGLSARPGESDLCGLHQGVPITQRSLLEPSFEPSRIYLFRGPILRVAEGDQLELDEQIRITLLHELGHHFGLEEEDLERLGYD